MLLEHVLYDPPNYHEPRHTGQGSEAQGAKPLAPGLTDRTRWSSTHLHLS